MDKSEFGAWEREKRLIPEMIGVYCRDNHKGERKAEGVGKRALCRECEELKDYALFRLDKCPFKADKQFCSFCKIHCYKPEMREKIKRVMRYSGPRMLFTHPIFAVSHAVRTVKYKKSVEKSANNTKKETDGNSRLSGKANDDGNREG